MVESVSVLRSSYRFQKPHTPISIFTDPLRCSLSHGSVTRARLLRSPQDSAFLDIGHFVTSGSSPGEPPSRSGKDTIGRILEPGPIETRIPLKFLDQKSKEREEWNFDKERAAVHLALPDKLIKSTTIVIMVVTIIIERMVENS
ncbi:hypothetical protein HZH68_016173 [Vespula germanica]|uniref:Uncharacterized protein n=1 Tax=Vespula germanica TaxID=30212 RepID=A0A834J3H9_VESGE|nr:hypothetical protein HZH68_016173 [Vespula germanica]